MQNKKQTKKINKQGLHKSRRNEEQEVVGYRDVELICILCNTQQLTVYMLYMRFTCNSNTTLKTSGRTRTRFEKF